MRIENNVLLSLKIVSSANVYWYQCDLLYVIEFGIITVGIFRDKINVSKIITSKAVLLLCESFSKYVK